MNVLMMNYHLMNIFLMCQPKVNMEFLQPYLLFSYECMICQEIFNISQIINRLHYTISNCYRKIEKYSIDHNFLNLNIVHA